MGQLINQIVANLSGGVTQQMDEISSEIYVKEMVNCIPNASRGIFRRNPLKNTSLLAMGTTVSDDYYIYTYKRNTTNEVFLVFIGNGHWKVFNALTNNLVASGTSSYLNIPLGVSPKDAFSLVTINDFTFVANKYIKVLKSSVVDGVTDSHKTTGVYWITRTSETTTESTNEATYTIEGTETFRDELGKQGYLIEGFAYLLNGALSKGIRDTRYTNNIDKLTGDKIIADLAGQLGYSYSGSIIYKTNMGANDAWNWGDSEGNTASNGFKGEVRAPSELPAKLPATLNGLVVNVTQNTETKLDDYWLQYSGETWVETRKPGMQNTISSVTMPHVLVNNNGVFSFVEFTETALAAIGITNESDPFGWKKREIGDEESAPMPSFVNDYITDIFFYRNRLGFISNNNVILSENNRIGNFFNTSSRIIPDTDPIDLTIATTNIVNLNYVVATNNTLILFSDNSQFALTAGNNPLTPLTATIETLSHYKNSNKVRPATIGNKTYFISETADASQLFLYNATEASSSTEAYNISKHIPSYLSKEIISLIGDNILGYIFMTAKNDSKTIIVCNHSISGQEIKQNAFHKWTFEYDIVGLSIIDGVLYVCLKNGLDYYNGTIDLETPSDISIISYLDSIPLSTGEYESTLFFSKWFLKDNNGNGSSFYNRLQIKNISYILNKNSYYSTYVVTDDGSISDELAFWNDSLVWDDTDIWVDEVEYYTIRTDNQKMISVLGKNDDTNIFFKNDSNNPDKGFELYTVNYEGYFHSRSQRL